MRKSSWLGSLTVATTLVATTTPSAAAPIQYVKVCSLYGSGFAYIPGTNTCINLDTGDVRTQTERGTVRGLSTQAGRIGTLEGDVSDLNLSVGDLKLSVGNLQNQVDALRSEQQKLQARFNADFRNANDGSAIAMALEDPDLIESEHFGIKVNWGNYLTSNAFGMSFAGVLAEQGGNRLTLSGGVAFTGHNVGGHAGVQFSW